jgi:hypothetical protein
LSVQPLVWWVRWRVASRARLVAAARRVKSALMRSRPCMRAQDFTGAVCRVAVDGGVTAGRGVGRLLAHIRDQISGGLSVAGVAGGHGGGGDDLTVRVDGDVAFVAVEAAMTLLCPYRAWGSTVEITRSAATLRAMRSSPSAPVSRS